MQEELATKVVIGGVVVLCHPEGSGPSASQPEPPAWTQQPGEEREEYKENKGLFLVHRYQPSSVPGQKYDVFIFLMRHVPGPTPNQTHGFKDIDKAEFYFGKSWGHRVFPESGKGGYIGVGASAWGKFLATCKVSFTDGKPPVILHRYVDFGMEALNR